MRGKVCAWVAAVILALGGGFVAPGVASADTSGEVASCSQGDGGIGWPYNGGEYTGSGDWYAYSFNLITLSGSACEDIQIINPYSMSPSMKFRIRFYPSSGGNYANSWKHVVFGGYTILATDVANGTLYRVEGIEQVSGCPGCTQTVLYENYRLAW